MATTDHVTRGDFYMSDRVALNGRSTCNKHMCDRNTCKPFLNCMQAHLAPKPPVFELQRMRERSCKCTSSQSRIMTKVPIKLYISNTTTVLHGQKQSWEIIQTRCDQLTGPHGSCQILHCSYTSQPPCSPVSLKRAE